MKKILIIAFLISAGIKANAQKLKEYKASNGVIYKIGDTVQMKKGSGTDGKFLYLARTGFVTAMGYDTNKSSDQLLADRYYSNAKGIIKKMKVQKMLGKEITGFVVDFKTPINFLLLVDDAIQAKEF